MKLGEENRDNKNASFLDLGISIGNINIEVGLFDLRDAFKLHYCVYAIRK